MGAVIVIGLFVVFLLASVRDGVDSREPPGDGQRVWWPGMPR